MDSMDKNSGVDDARQRTSAFDRSDWTDEEKRFCEHVDVAMRKRYSVTPYNDGTFHAVQLIYRFFLHASKKMRIFSGNLMQYASDDAGRAGMMVYADEHVLDAIEAFLSDRGTSLKIVLEDGRLDGGVEEHPLVKMLERLRDDNKLKGSCEIVGLAPSRARQLKEEGWPLHHMMIMDRSAYRVEIDKNQRIAKVNLNDFFTAWKLIRFFDKKLCDGAVPIWPLPVAKNNALS